MSVDCGQAFFTSCDTVYAEKTFMLPLNVSLLSSNVLVISVRCGFHWCISKLNLLLHFQPAKYLAHLIGHEGPGSLLSELKARGWVNALVAGRKSGARGFSFFSISVELTEDGLGEYLFCFPWLFVSFSAYTLLFVAMRSFSSTNHSSHSTANMT